MHLIKTLFNLTRDRPASICIYRTLSQLLNLSTSGIATRNFRLFSRKCRMERENTRDFEV